MRTSLRHMLRRKNKKRAGSGFTLAETLTAILLIGFVGLIITGGIQAGLYARSRVVDAANAEVLLSTTLTELQNELEAAQEIRTDDSGKLSYYLTASGWRSLQNGTETEPGIRVQVFKGEGAEPGSSADMNYLLVSDAAASRRLYAEFDSISYDEAKGIFTVRGLEVIHKTNGKTLASLAEYKIVFLNR